VDQILIKLSSQQKLVNLLEICIENRLKIEKEPKRANQRERDLKRETRVCE
jgi:hypothetical protein